MSDGFENGFIIDLSNAKYTSEIISELSDILDMPEAKEKDFSIDRRMNCFLPHLLYLIADLPDNILE